MGNDDIMPYIKDRNFKQYLESESWKCDKSPSGAHHWIIGGLEQTCKFCGEVREVNGGRFIAFSKRPT